MPRPATKAIATITGTTLNLTKAGSYTFEYLPSGNVKIKLDGGHATVLSAGEYASIASFNLAPGATIDSEIRIDGVTFTEAGPAGPFEAHHSLNDLIGRLIMDNGIAWTVDNLVINGSQADTFKVLWDYLDDAYVAGNNYYNVPLNETFVRLGAEYVEYLAAGGEPFTFVTAKYAADSNANGIPQREQSMHDNLLGNLNMAALDDRFDDPLLSELRALIPDEYEARPYYDGNEPRVGSATHDAIRAFDYDHGWDRPDYLDRSYNAMIDPLARDPLSPNNMYYGSGNPADDWNVVRHEGAQVELGLKIKHRFGDEYAEGPIGPDGVATYNVATGASPFAANRAEWNFDFAATDYSPDQDFTYTLELDIDPGEGEQWVTLYSSAAPLDTDLGGGSTFQNSSNIVFYAAGIDVDPDTAGIQPYTLGDGTFGVRLTAYDADTGLYVAHNEVLVIVGDGNPWG